MFRAYKAANREWPTFDDDEVIDYLILESLAAKVAKEDDDNFQKARKEQEVKQHQQKALKELESYR